MCHPGTPCSAALSIHPSSCSQLNLLAPFLADAAVISSPRAQAALPAPRVPSVPNGQPAVLPQAAAAKDIPCQRRCASLEELPGS